jgi:hypothetical protein
VLFQLLRSVCSPRVMDRGQIAYRTEMDELERGSGVLKKYLGVSF